MVRPCGHALALALCALSLLFACAAAASVSVTLEPNPVHLDESFSVVFKAGKAPDGEPDFSPLKKSFTILGQSRSSHISIINGDYNKTIEWTLTLMAKREGQLTIPPIAFGNDRSEPVTVTVAGGAVADAGRDAEVFLEVEAEPKNPYVQAQILYTVRVLVRRGASLNSADLSEPSLADALIEKLGDDKSYAASREGLGYRVIERKYAIFPQKSGPAVIEPMVLEAQLSAGGHSVFDRFFNHLPSRTLRVRSGAVPLQVKAVPAAFTGKRWLPASKLELEEAWSKYPPQTTAGEPITRTLSLKAESATVGLLPELAPKLPARKPGEEIKQYPDQPFLNEEKHFNGINSIRQEKTALVITEAGDYTLPGLEIPWWNTRTDQMQIARIPERLVSVLPAPQTSQQPAQVAPPAAETPTQPASTPAPAAPPSNASAEKAAELWRGLALLFGAGWAITLAAWWLSARKSAARGAARAAGGNPHATAQSAVNRLREACRANDAAAAKQALLAWANARWPLTTPLGLCEIGERGGAELEARILELNAALYGSNPGSWQGLALWSAFNAVKDGRENAERSQADALEPLFKL